MVIKFIISLSLILSCFVSTAQNDSLIPLLGLRQSLNLVFFPTLETGIVLSTKFKKLNINIGAYIHHLNRPEQLINPLKLPYYVTDSTIVYRNEMERKYKNDWKMGIDSRIKLKLFEKQRNLKIITKIGIDFSFGNNEIINNYWEGYVKYRIDSTSGTLFYLDESNNPVQNVEDSFGYISFLTQSEWKYNTYGAFPYFTLIFLSKKLPFSFGIRWNENLYYYDLRTKSINDPLGILEAKQEKYFTHSAMMYLTMSMYFNKGK
jgi:hypothetical protein